MDCQLQGIKLHYELAGQGQPIVLLHGWGCSTDTFRPVAEHLAAHFTVYNLDLPGFGQSGEPPVPWDTVAYANFVAAFLAECHVQSPILVAHSFGARLAIRLAAQGYTKKMVLTGAAGLKPKRPFSYYVKVYSYKAAKAFLRLPFWAGKREAILEKWRQKRGSADYQQASALMRQCLTLAVNEDLRPLLPQIKASTLLFWGEDDTATPLWQGEIMAKEIPDAGLVKVAGVGHYAYLERLPYFLKVVDAFLEPERRGEYV